MAPEPVAPPVDPATGEILEPGNSDLRPFGAWLAEQRGGALQGELTETLAELVRAVVEHEKPGSLTLKVTVKPGEDGVLYVLVFDDVTAKIPQPPRGGALFHPDEQGSLTRHNPRQGRLPLRDAGAKED